MEYKLVLGLEIHLHLKTKNKMFCGCSADIYTAEPNTHTCPVCLGLPGALPVPNAQAIKKIQLLGLALGCDLSRNSQFARKHYFYPDLAKGYQLTQTKNPFCLEGKILLSSGNVAEIDHIHLEEDTAKSFHQGDKTLIDFNKSGMPLVEIVTTPTFKSIEDAVEFSKKIQEVVRTLGIGDVDMEKGQMRLEANISMRTPEMAEKNELPSYKVEIKNINSFRFMERAVRAEMERQTEILAGGGIVAQENRGFNEATGKTVSQRDKEDAHDYRYFPEPDIPPMEFSEDYIEELKHSLPELPQQRIQKYKDLGLKDYDAEFFASTVNIELSEKLNRLVKFGADIKLLAPFLINKVEYREMPDLDILKKLKEKDDRVTDTAQLEEIITKVIENNPTAVTDYRNGKLASVEFILGQVMKETKGKADPQVSRELIIKHLSN